MLAGEAKTAPQIRDGCFSARGHKFDSSEIFFLESDVGSPAQVDH